MGWYGFSCEENRVILQEKLPEAILTTYDSEEKAGEILSEAISWASVIGIGQELDRVYLPEDY